MIFWIPEPWFIQTPKGDGLCKAIFDYTATENPIFMVQLLTGEILCFDMADCVGTENFTYGIVRPDAPKNDEEVEKARKFNLEQLMKELMAKEGRRLEHP